MKNNAGEKFYKYTINPEKIGGVKIYELKNRMLRNPGLNREDARRQFSMREDEEQQKSDEINAAFINALTKNIDEYYLKNLDVSYSQNEQKDYVFKIEIATIKSIDVDEFIEYIYVLCTHEFDVCCGKKQFYNKTKLNIEIRFV